MWDCQWNELTLNAEDLSYMLDDVTTPVKECGDLAYYATYSGRVCSQHSSDFNIFHFVERLSYWTIFS